MEKTSWPLYPYHLGLTIIQKIALFNEYDEYDKDRAKIAYWVCKGDNSSYYRGFLCGVKHRTRESCQKHKAQHEGIYPASYDRKGNEIIAPVYNVWDDQKKLLSEDLKEAGVLI